MNTRSRLRRRAAAGAVAAAAAVGAMLVAAAPASALPDCRSMETQLDRYVDDWTTANHNYEIALDLDRFDLASFFFQERTTAADNINNQTDDMRQVGCFGGGE